MHMHALKLQEPLLQEQLQISMRQTLVVDSEQLDQLDPKKARQFERSRSAH